MLNTRNIAVGVLALLLIAAGVWYWQRRRASTPPKEEPAGIGAQIFEKAQNPVADKVPETNPFESTPNPFKKETNPLKAIYQNPFGE